MELQSGAISVLNAWFQSTIYFYTGSRCVKKYCHNESIDSLSFVMLYTPKKCEEMLNLKLFDTNKTTIKKIHIK